jgi:hypothetical protein
VIEHIDELAELYALGSLDDLERARVERHAATCAACAERLYEAGETVADIAAGEPAFEPSEHLRERLAASIAPPRRGFAMHWWQGALALAAALVLALIPAWLAVDRSRLVSQTMRQDERALARLAAAQTFNRAVFMAHGNRAMDAKVLYGPRGDWYYVVVMHPKPDMQVAYVHNGRMEMLGTVAMHGESGTLYLPVNHKMDELALLQGGNVVAAAHLAY